MRKYLLLVFAAGWLWSVLPVQEVRAEEQPRPVRVVIDPGHGGENLGARYEDYTEKDMTLMVALAMKEELEQYEGIEVYLTREDDQDLSLKERAVYAAELDADFLFCLHFNMSEDHILYGTECWVSAFGDNFSKGYAFAREELEQMTGLGLYSRGIKTRLNDEGTDYYGIIRQSTERNIPCVLIEHCHLDHKNDQAFYDHGDKLREFGRLDATAVAKYFRLSSEALKKDYSNYQPDEAEILQTPIQPDLTEPEECRISLEEQNPETGELTVRVTASDKDSGLLYYSYSTDGGQEYSELLQWPEGEDSFTFSVQQKEKEKTLLCVTAYNGYDLYTVSNELSVLPAAPTAEEETAETVKAMTAAETFAEEKKQEVQAAEQEQIKAQEQTTDPENPQVSEEMTTWKIAGAILLGGGLISLLILRIGSRKPRKRQHKKRK